MDRVSVRRLLVAIAAACFLLAAFSVPVLGLALLPFGLAVWALGDLIL